MPRRAEVRITGFVQGVFFRAEARARARSLGLAGWVRNAPDGSVEAVFEGDSEKVESMVEWCRSGPRGAQVEHVEVDWATPQGEQAFSVR